MHKTSILAFKEILKTNWNPLYLLCGAFGFPGTQFEILCLKFNLLRVSFPLVHHCFLDVSVFTLYVTDVLTLEHPIKTFVQKWARSLKCVQDCFRITIKLKVYFFLCLNQWFSNFIVHKNHLEHRFEMWAFQTAFTGTWISKSVSRI